MPSTLHSAILQHCAEDGLRQACAPQFVARPHAPSRRARTTDDEHTPQCYAKCEQPYYTKAACNQRGTQATRKLFCGSGALTRPHVTDVDDSDDRQREYAKNAHLEGTTHVHSPPRDNEPLAQR